MKKQQNKPLIKKQPMLVLSLAIFILIISGGYCYFRYEKKIIRQEQYSNLKTIADLKVNQILHWREDRLADAQVVSEGSFIRQNFQRWLLSHDSTLEKNLLERFSLLRYNYKYEDVFVVSAGGKLLLDLNANLRQIDSETSDYCKKALQDKKAFLSDFYFSPARDTIHFDIFAPILNDSNIPVAVLVLRVNPYDYLYPLMQSWPTSSKSAETLIIRKDGDSILYENELRHISNTALRLWIPLTKIEVPAVQAVLGHVGIYEGSDYRGVRVLADIRPVPDTPWFMIAKVDQSEIFSELRYRIVIVIIITLLLLLFFGIGISWFYNNRQKNIYRKLLESGTALQESERKFSDTIKYLDQGYYSCMMDGVVLEHNQAFNRILGIDIAKDMKGSKLPDFWLNPDDRKVYLQELMASGFITNFVINAKTIGGENVVVMVNSHLVKDEQDKPVRIEGTFTDFTRMKLMEDALKESESKYRTLFENAQVGMYRSRIDGAAMLDVNKKFCEILGFTREESLGKAGRILWVDPEDRNTMMKLLREQGGVLYNYEARLLGKNGEIRDVLASIELNPAMGSLDGTFVDITERKKAEEQLRKLNRIYSLLSDINQAIVRTHVPKELYDKVCDIAVGQGGFGMAWIGLVDETSQKLGVIAQAGRTNGYNEQVNISLKGKPLSYCPIDSALRQGKHKICKIIENKEMAPCQRNAYDLGFRSSASFPLKVSDILKGALTFYSDEPDFFDEAELKLLDELALDISFAMEHVEKEVGRKQAEEALKASEKRFRITAGSLIDVVYEWDLKEKIEWFGDIDGIMGYPDNGFPRTLSGWAAKLHPEDTEKVMAMIEGHLKRSEPYISEYRVMNKEGEWRWWTARGTALRDEQNIPYWWIGSITDITGRKLAEEALKISNERLVFATEGANLGIWNWNIVTGELIWSDQCKALFGIPLDENMSYQRFSDALHPDDRERTNMVVKDALDNNKDYDIEYRSLWPDESIHWLAAKGRGFYDTTGKAVRLEGIVMDITRRKLEEETLRIKNQVFEDSIASQSIADNTGMITHVNPAFLSLWGYTSNEQAIGKSVGSFFADQADAVPVLEALAAHDAWEGEFRAKRTDGITFISRGFATSLRNSRGELVGYQSTNLDVTKEREAEKEIIKLNAELEDRVVLRTAQLEATNKELESFSYSVSHDLRAPLRHVSGYVELLNKRFQADLPEKGRHYLDSIADSVHVMGMLIDDLLQFSRTGRMEIVHEVLDMNEIVQEVKESISKDNPDRKIEWVLGKMVSVYGDEAMLRIVWMNLLSNAVKFTRTRKKARIEIGVSKEKRELVFFVRDNGVGFDMQYAQKLFGVFQRLHPSEEFEGTGIGLANVSRIVLRHGGHTWAEAEPDKGAVFYFSIPKK